MILTFILHGGINIYQCVHQWLDGNLDADPGVASSIPARSHTFVETDHEIISTVILLPSTKPFMKRCCQLQAELCGHITG